MADAAATIFCSETFSEYTTSLEQLKGHCWRCGVVLTGRRRHWCSDECSQWWWVNHDWNGAREERLKEDNWYCQKCGADGYPLTQRYFTHGSYAGRTMFPVKLEVNHKEPRVGRGYQAGCHNHQENLETLCHDCHVKVTNQQRRDRMRNKVNA